MKVLCAFRDGSVEEIDVPEAHWGSPMPMRRVNLGNLAASGLLHPQLWRDGKNVATEVFVYYEEGADQKTINSAGARALAEQIGRRRA